MKNKYIEGNKKCAIRFDDICDTMDWQQFNRAISLMDKYDVKPLLGVVPQNEDPDLMKNEANPNFWDIIKQLQKRGYVIAMHGYRHVYDIKHHGIVNKGLNSEYAGHPYEVQLFKIKRGKEIMEKHGIYTDIFFAPAHSYDTNTLRALSACGFKYVSDGKSRKPYVQEGIKCIPCRFYGTPKTGSTGVYISVCHSSNWDKYPENYEQLERYCRLNKEVLINFDELLNQSCGVYWMEKLNEKLYIFFHDHIRSSLASSKILNRLYHLIKK